MVDLALLAGLTGGFIGITGLFFLAGTSPEILP